MANNPTQNIIKSNKLVDRMCSALLDVPKTEKATTEISKQFDTPFTRPSVKVNINDATGTLIGDSVTIQDGDTLHIYKNGSKVREIRTVFSDSREVSHSNDMTSQPYGASQGEALYQFVNTTALEGSKLVIDGVAKDPYKRSTAFILAEDSDGNQADYAWCAVRTGTTALGKITPKESTGRYKQEDYQKAERLATDENLGIHTREAEAALAAYDKKHKRENLGKYKYDGKFNTKRHQKDYNLDDVRYRNKFKIGDVWLDIPPTHVTISQLRTSYDIPIVGYESKPIASPSSRIGIKLNLIFTGDRIHTDLRRILVQFRYCPFNLIRSKDLFEKLESNIEDTRTSELEPYKHTYYIPVTMDEYVLYTIEGHPGTIGLSIQMSLFNFQPYFNTGEEGTLEYFEYNEKLITDKVSIDSVLKRTPKLEDSCHPYNLVIEEELKRTFDINFGESSDIRILKVDKSLSQAKVEEYEDKEGFALSPEDFFQKVKDFKFDDIAHSISISYRNNFAWQPLTGYANPTAQYIGPGDSRVSINIKTNDTDNINKLLKTFHEKIKENEYAFYDDRYFILTPLTLFTETTVASISDIAVTSLDGHPGWSDINIQLHKSSFEYDMQYNNAAAEYDDYWGLHRIAKITENPEVKAVLNQIRNAQNGNIEGGLLIDNMTRVSDANTVGMDTNARLAINNELIAMANGLGKDEQWVKENIIVSSAKTETLIGPAAAFREFMNTFKFENYYDFDGADLGTVEKDIHAIVDSAIQANWLSFWYNAKLINLMDKDIDRGGPLSKVWPGRKASDITKKEKIDLAKQYMNKWNQYSADGTVLCLRYKNKDAAQLLNDMKTTGTFPDNVFTIIKNLKPNSTGGKLSVKDVGIHYKIDSSNKHKTAAQTEKEQAQKLHGTISRLTEKQREIIIEPCKPFAAHRYFPDIDKLVQPNLMYSSTIGSWYYNDAAKTLGQKISSIKDEVANCVSPTQDYIGWQSTYIQQNYKGLYDKIADSKSPTAIMDGLTHPAKKREFFVGYDESYKNVDDSKLLYARKDMASISKNDDANNYPWGTWQPGALADGFGTKILSREGNAAITSAYNQREAWINTHVRRSIVLSNENTSSVGDVSAQIGDMYNSSQSKFGVLSRDSKTVLEPAATPVSVIAPIVAPEAINTVKGDYTSIIPVTPENTVKIGYRKNPEAAIAYLELQNRVNENTTAKKRNNDLSKETRTNISGKVSTPIKGAFDKAILGTASTTDVRYIDSLDADVEKELTILKKLNTKNSSAMQDISTRLSNEFLLGLKPTSGMENAFPTFKFYVIAEDTTEVRYFSLDDYYDFRLIQDFVVIRDKNSPVHILKARVVIDPRYITTNPMWNPKAVRTGNAERDDSYNLPFNQLDTEKENSWDRGKQPFREGMRVCVKLGYSTDPRTLDTVFIGTIVSMNGRQETNVYDIECHGDGRELTVPAVDTTKTFKAINFAGIISQILRSNTNVVHFGRVYGAFLERFSKKHHQLLELGLAGFNLKGLLCGGAVTGSIWWRMASTTALMTTIAGSLAVPVSLTMAAYYFAPKVMNALTEEGDRAFYRNEVETYSLLAGKIADFKGWWQGSTFNAKKAEQQYSVLLRQTYNGDNNPVDDNIYAVDIWNAFWGNSFSLNVNARRSIWEILQVVHKMYPSFALDVRPYGNRSTLYLGPIDGDYFRTDDPLQAMAPALTWISGKGKNITEQQYESLKELGLKIGNYYQIQDGEERKIAPRMPFQKHHVVTSSDDIIVNGIKSTPSRGWNKVVVSYATEAKEHDNGEAPIIELKADSDIDPGALRTKYEQIDFTGEKRLAEFYALGLLKEGVEKLYGGTLIIKGNQKIEPYDKIYICDSVNRMFGWIQAETVIHKFDTEMGFTTHIVPNMLCDINQDAYVSTMQVARKYFAEKMLGNFAISLGMIGAQFAITALLPATVPALLITTAVLVVGGVAQYYYNKNQHSDDSVDKQARPESIDLMGYFEKALNATRAVDNVRYGMYLGIFVDMYRKGLKPGLKKFSDNGGASKAFSRTWNATKNSWKWTSSSFKKSGAILAKDEGATMFASAVKKTLSQKGIPLAKTALGTTANTTLKVVKKVSPFMKKFWPVLVLTQLVEMGPLLYETMMVKYAKGNNTIVIHPLWSKNKLMTAGLEGYKNNDAWMHIKDVVINAKRYLSNTFDAINDMYQDIDFSWSTMADGVAEAKVYDGGANTKSSSLVTTKAGNIKDAYSTSIKQDNVAELVRQKLIAKNGEQIGQHVFNVILRKKEETNLPWDLIASTLAVENKFRTSGTSPAGAIGLFQLMPNSHGANLERSAGVSVGTIASNQTKYSDAIIDVGMDYLLYCYNNAYKKVMSNSKYNTKENIRQAIYELVYLHYNTGNIRDSDLDTTLFTNEILVKRSRSYCKYSNTYALDDYNRQLNAVYESAEKIQIKKGN